MPHSQQRLEKAINELDAEALNKWETIPRETWDIITNKLNQCAYGITQLTFPALSDVVPAAEEEKDTPSPIEAFSYEAYQAFFWSLSQQLHGIETTLPVLILQPCMPDAVKAFFDSKSSVPIDELVIHLPSGDDATAAVITQLMQSLSNSSVPKIRLEGKMTDAQAKIIAEALQSTPCTTEITLPLSHRSSMYQRTIDRLISTYQYRAINQPKQEEEKLADEKASPLLDRPKRTRPEPTNKQAFLDSLVFEADVQAQQAVAQQQEVQAQVQNVHQVEAEQEQQEQAEVRDNIPPDLIATGNFDEFYGRLTDQNNSPFPAEVYLAKSKVRNYWHHWFGHIPGQDAKDGNPPTKSLINTYMTHISPAALQQLICAPECVAGLNSQHWPRGFKVRHMKNKHGFHMASILDYDPALAALKPAKPDPLALVLKEKPKSNSLSYPIVEHIISNLSADHPVRKIWNSLQEDPYNRDADRLFRQRLPELLHYPVDELNIFFNSDPKIQPDKKILYAKLYILDKAKFDAFKTMENNEAEAYTALVNLQRATQINWRDCRNIVSAFTNLYKAKLRHAHPNPAKPQPRPPAINQSVLYSLLQDDPLQARLADWAKKIPELQLDALLDVYNQRGRAGLDKLFTQWDATDLKCLQKLHDQLFKHAESYAPLVDDAERYQKAIDTILSFSPDERAWWDRLLTQHGEYIGFDDLPTLVASFNEFRRIVQDNGLDFYPLTLDSFKNTRSLPLALAHMTDLLKQCSDENRVQQWKCITQLSLFNWDVPRKIQDANPLPQTGRPPEICQFIVPEMNIDKDHPDDNNPGSTSKGSELDAAKQSFFRNLSKKQYLLPLKFYQDALKVIEESEAFDINSKKQLITLLLTSTTGETNFLFLRQEGDDPLDQWKKIIDQLKLDDKIVFKFLTDKKKKEIRSHVIQYIHDWKTPPSLPVLHKLMTFILSRNILKEGGRLEDACRKLGTITEKTGESIYKGMRFYDEEEYKKSKDPLFYTLVDAATKYLEKPTFLENKADARELDQAVVCLIGLFQVQPGEEVDTLKKHLSLLNETHPDALMETVRLLSQIHTNKKKDGSNLTNADLIEWLKTIKREYEHGFVIVRGKEHTPIMIIRAICNKHYKDFFPNHFFGRLMPFHIQEKINETLTHAFKNPIDNVKVSKIAGLLIHAEAKPCQDFIYNLANITKSLSQTEKDRLLDYLQDEKFYSPPVPAKDMLHLTEVLARSSSTKELIYLLDKMKEIKDAPPLSIQKITFYLEHVLPSIEKQHRHILSKIEIIDLSIAMFLRDRTEIQYLNRDNFVECFPITNRDKDQQYEMLSKLSKLAEDENNEESVQDQLREYARLYEPQNVELQQLLAQPEIQQARKQEREEAEKQRQERENQKQQQEEEKKREEEKEEEEKKHEQEEAKQKEQTQPQAEPVQAPEKGGAFNWIKNKIRGKTASKVEHPNPVQAQPDQGKVQTLKTFLKNTRLGKAVSNLLPSDSAASAEPQPPPQPIKEEPFLNQAKVFIDKVLKEKNSFRGIFSDLLKNIEEITIKCPGSKKLIVDFFNQYAASYTSIQSAWPDTMLLHKTFLMLKENDHESVLRSLCFHYTGKTNEERTPKALVELIKQVDLFGEEHQLFLLRMISQLLNAEKFNEDDFKKLISEFKGRESDLYPLFENPPFPGIKTVLRWNDDKSETLAEHYGKFNLNPCPRPVDSFDLKIAKDKVLQFTSHATLNAHVENLNIHIQNVRTIQTIDLIAEFKNYQNLPLDQQDPARLVAIAAELLYRSKSKEAEAENKKSEPFELNTTQYLSVLSLLLSGQHNLHEIGTGEGKSRITAVLAACQFALGKTVDVVTSDISLATRDYFEYQAYHQMIGAETSLLYADSPITEYKLKGGINYSDTNQLSLFRNFARSRGEENRVLNSNKKLRAGIGDEGDTLLFDMSQTLFNCSEQANPNLKNMEWIYPVLIDFYTLRTDLAESKLYFKDIDRHNAEFRNYVENLPQLTDEQRLAFNAIPDNQIEIWLQSAYQAQQLIRDTHYYVEKERKIQHAEGPKVVSEAQVLIDKIKSPGSKFSLGMHQCLHAYLNMLKHADVERINPELRELAEELQQYPYDFHIDPEKQIVYSSSATSFLEDYEEGTFLALTGSQGSFAQQYEASTLYDMNFVTVPRHYGLFRDDQSVRLTKNADRHLSAILDYIDECQKEGRPILLVCEDDQQSQKMHKQVTKALEKRAKKSKKDQPAVQLIDNTLSHDEKTARIGLAGQPGQVTISCLVSRGTDIKLSDDVSKRGGLSVLVTYLPDDERDLVQRFGRAGRMGQKGSARLVLNKEEVKKKLNKRTLTDGLYTNTAQYLRTQFANAEKAQQMRRLVNQVNHDLMKKLHNQFYIDVMSSPGLSSEDQSQCKSEWTIFLRGLHEAWSKHSPLLQEALDEAPLNYYNLRKALKNYHQEIEAHWTQYSNSINKIIDPQGNHQKLAPDAFPLPDLTRLAIAEKVHKEAARIKVYKKYDSAQAGFATLYQSPLAETRAILRGKRQLFANTRAAWRGEGILFANLRAWRRKEASVMQVLFNYDPSRAKKAEKKAAQQSSTASMLRKVSSPGQEEKKLNMAEKNPQTSNPQGNTQSTAQVAEKVKKVEEVKKDALSEDQSHDDARNRNSRGGMGM